MANSHIRKRQVLEALTRPGLIDLAYEHSVPAPTTLRKPALVAALARKRSLSLEDLLASLKREQLKALCRKVGLDDSGREKRVIIDRLLGSGGAAPARSRRTRQNVGQPKASAEKPMAKKTTRKAATTTRKKKSAKRPVEPYEHKGHTRLNNPPVGLVTPETDPPPPPKRAKKTYRYDPHLDPELNFDPQQVRDDLAGVIEQGLAEEPAPDTPEAGRIGATLAEGRLAAATAKLKRTKTALDRAKAALETLKKAQEPYLNWAGKAERTSFDVRTVSLHVHERIDPRTIIEAVRARNGNGHSDDQLPLFETPDANPPLREAVEFYKHPHGWTNRLIAGDSLLVMNSLLE